MKIIRDSKALLSRFKIVKRTKFEPYELQNDYKKLSVNKYIKYSKILKLYIKLYIRIKIARDSKALL